MLHTVVSNCSYFWILRLALSLYHKNQKSSTYILCRHYSYCHAFEFGVLASPPLVASMRVAPCHLCSLFLSESPHPWAVLCNLLGSKTLSLTSDPFVGKIQEIMHFWVTRLQDNPKVRSTQIVESQDTQITTLKVAAQRLTSDPQCGNELTTPSQITSRLQDTQIAQPERNAEFRTACENGQSKYPSKQVSSKHYHSKCSLDLVATWIRF